jgi:hypothetical protein
VLGLLLDLLPLLDLILNLLFLLLLSDPLLDLLLSLLLVPLLSLLETPIKVARRWTLVSLCEEPSLSDCLFEFCMDIFLFMNLDGHRACLV